MPFPEFPERKILDRQNQNQRDDPNNNRLDGEDCPVRTSFHVLLRSSADTPPANQVFLNDPSAELNFSQYWRVIAEECPPHHRDWWEPLAHEFVVKLAECELRAHLFLVIFAQLQNL